MKDFTYILNKLRNNPLDEGLFDLDEEEFAKKSTDIVNIPRRIYKGVDKICKSFSYSKHCRVDSKSFSDEPICIENDLITFLNKEHKIGSVLVIKELDNFTKEFNISGFEAPAIYVNHFSSNSLKDSIGKLVGNNIHFNLDKSINNADIFLHSMDEYRGYKLYFNNNKDIDYKYYEDEAIEYKHAILVPPCVEFASDNKDTITLSNCIINCDNKRSRVIFNTDAKIIMNNIKSSDIKEILIVPKKNSPTNNISKQLYSLFEPIHEFKSYDIKNYDLPIDIITKSMKDIINYYKASKRYVYYNLDMPYKVRDIKLSDVLDVSGMSNLDEIRVDYGNKIKMLITKNIGKAELYWSNKFKESVKRKEINPPQTKDGWYISFKFFE